MSGLLHELIFEDENLRHVLVDDLAGHIDAVRPGDGGFAISCTCGTEIGTYLNGWGDEQAESAWNLHLADSLLLTIRAQYWGAVEDDELAAWEEIRNDHALSSPDTDNEREGKA